MRRIMDPKTAPLSIVMCFLLHVGGPGVAAQDADFLFDRPLFTLSAGGGWTIPGEGGDIFDFTREQLTVDEGDFASPAFLMELGARVTERLDVAAGLEYASRTVNSEMRDWVTQDDRPITQSTEFRRTRLMGSVKGYLLPRGRTISQLAWVPNRWSPYLGLGAGYTWYEFFQEGDFVDFETLDIFSDRFRSTGSGGTLHALAGVELSLSPRFLVRGEYRYIWGDGGFSGSDFEGFGDIDLSGSSFTLGLGVRM
ncbi:MAG: outer membrane beta-barrel protein [Gemmatimonadota bacterium]|jgi:hypothetical protein